MKKNAWTMAELTIAVIILLILSGMCASIIKGNKDNKISLFAYSAYKNLEDANNDIKANSSSFDLRILSPKVDGTNPREKYCLGLANIFSLDSYDCSTNQCETDTCFSNGLYLNPMVLANGIKIYGTANKWEDSGNGYFYKDLLIDTLGMKQKDPLQIDKIPMRTYSSPRLNTLLLSDCSGNPIQDGKKNAYCGKTTINYADRKDILSFEIYKQETKESTTANRILSSMSALEAYCTANDWKDTYGIEACAKAKYKVSARCITSTTQEACKEGGFDICPEGGKNQNPDDIPCFVLPQTPHVAGGFLVNAVLDQY